MKKLAVPAGRAGSLTAALAASEQTADARNQAVIHPARMPARLYDGMAADAGKCDTWFMCGSQ
jgi:hypothetical protein